MPTGEVTGNGGCVVDSCEWCLADVADVSMGRRGGCWHAWGKAWAWTGVLTTLAVRTAHRIGEGRLVVNGARMMRAATCAPAQRVPTPAPAYYNNHPRRRHPDPIPWGAMPRPPIDTLRKNGPIFPNFRPFGWEWVIYGLSACSAGLSSGLEDSY